MLVSPTTFLAAVSGLIRIGKAVKQGYLDRLLSDDYTVLLPPDFPHTGEKLRQASAEHIQRNRRDLLQPGKSLAGLYKTVGSAEVLNQDATDLFDLAMAIYVQDRRPEPIVLPDELGGGAISPVVVLTHREWVGEKSRARRARLGIEIANFAIDIISTQPDMLGMGRRATAVVGGLAPNLKALIKDELTSGDSDVSRGERLVKTFIRSSLQTVAERPEIFVSDQRWAPLVSGLVVPLHEHIETHGEAEMFALDRLEKVLRGPVAHSVLSALADNADTHMTSRFGKEEVLGAVTRSVLGALVSTEQGEFDLMDVFSGDGASMVYTAALDIAQKRPELFVDGDGAEHVMQRQFLSRMGKALKEAPRPYQWESGLASQLSVAALEVAGEYASTRIRAGADGTLWANAGVEVADRIIGEITAGFVDVARGSRTSPFERLFQREQAVDVLRIIALQVAKTPHMVTGESANPEVRNIAAGIASVFAEDTAGYLDGEDWKLIVSTGMALAAKNPGALFNTKPDGSPEQQVAVLAIRSVLGRAAENLKNGRTPGAILFGETLRETILATVEAASSSLLIDPANHSQGVGDETFAAHLTALEEFIDELLRLSAGDDPDFRMSASEWVYVYRSFVAHVLAHGSDAFSNDALNDSSSPFRVTHARILTALEGRSSDTRLEGAIE